MNKLDEIKTDWIQEADTYQFRQLAIEAEDIEWLIKQAEKVEQLEKVNRKLNHEIGAYSGKIRSIAEKLLTLEKEMLNA